EPHRRSLLLPGTPLDLFVTTTDLNGTSILVATGAGGISQRVTDHAQVLQLRSTGADDVFGRDSVSALAFAARATSSFPGAFAPVSPRSFTREVAGRHVDTDRIVDTFRTGHSGPPGSAQDSWFIDGGVLDNAPFGLVVEAIGHKRAETEVVRRLVYIEPDPGRHLGGGAAEAPASEPSDAAPGYLPALIRGVVTVKGSHSILHELQTLRDLNLRILEVGAIAALQADQVDAAVDEAFAQVPVAQGSTTGPGPASAWRMSEPDDVRALGDRLHAMAPSFTAAGYPSYCRLKVEVAGRRLADEIVERFVYPPRSSRSSFVRAAITAWARGHVEWQQPDPARLLELLGPVDVPYRERRLMFVLAGINRLYPEVGGGSGSPRRADLDALKSVAWTLLEQLRDAPRVAVGAVPEATIAFLGEGLSDSDVFESPEDFGAAHDADFTDLFLTYRTSLGEQLADSSLPVWQAFETHTAGWDDAHRRAVMSRYLGFALWDSLIFPTVALSSLPQFSPITVSQLSPLTAMALPTPEGGKLKGVSMHHFGGFLDPAWREGDYLWGRLDAAELILRMLRTSGPSRRPGAPTTSAQAAAEAGPWLRPALRAVLASEHDLRRVADLRAALALDVEALA
ncbi:MAG TPA: DUF3376 domain-containing protein, partial [Actinomycetales bacterium]